MRQRSMWMIVVAVAAALVLAGCSGTGQQPITTLAPPADTTTQSAGPSGQTPIGTPVTSGPWTIEVNSVERKPSAGGAKASSGNEILVVNFDLKNTGTKDAGVGPTSFTLADRIGTMFNAVSTSDPAFIHNIKQPIKAGATSKIRIAYEVRKGAGPFQWIFTPYVDSGGATPAVFEIN
jgi:hypothetical protein